MRARCFPVREDGPAAVEYAVIPMPIICDCLAAITKTGQNAGSACSQVAGTIH
jgi:Flp pilus assembly pilin Flp